MKRLLNVALIATLGLVGGACTVVSDPSSGASGTTSGSDKTTFMNRREQITEFAKLNLESLRSDMAGGQGEHLSSLAVLLEIDPNRQPAFFMLARDKFTVLFPSDRTTAPEMLAALKGEMQADPRFSQRLTLN